MRDLKSVLKTISNNTSNPSRYLRIKDKAIPWTCKQEIQKLVDGAVAMLEYLEQANKELVTKNNELIGGKTDAKKEEVRTTLPTV
jgi:hypothetical protein